VRAQVGGALAAEVVVALAAGYSQWLALTAGGRVFSCSTGDDGYGRGLALAPGAGAPDAAASARARSGDADGALGRRIGRGSAGALAPGALHPRRSPSLGRRCRHATPAPGLPCGQHGRLTAVSEGGAPSLVPLAAPLPPSQRFVQRAPGRAAAGCCTRAHAAPAGLQARQPLRSAGAGRVRGLPRAVRVAAGRCWGAAVGADGSLWAWGCGAAPGMWLGARRVALRARRQPARLPGFGRGGPWGRALGVAAGEHSIVVVTARGQAGDPDCLAWERL
jgi:hypothetical protein